MSSEIKIEESLKVEKPAKLDEQKEEIEQVFCFLNFLILKLAPIFLAHYYKSWLIFIIFFFMTCT